MSCHFFKGLYLKCSQKINTREWSLYLVCWDKTKGSSDKCQWDVVNMTVRNAHTNTTKTFNIKSDLK